MSDESVHCWPDGTAGRPCEHSIPDTSDETMRRYGWGWVEAPDAGSESGLGMFYACPWHRDDILTDEQRNAAIDLFCKAIGKTREEILYGD